MGCPHYVHSVCKPRYGTSRWRSPTANQPRYISERVRLSDISENGTSLTANHYVSPNPNGNQGKNSEIDTIPKVDKNLWGNIPACICSISISKVSSCALLHAGIPSFLPQSNATQQQGPKKQGIAFPWNMLSAAIARGSLVPRMDRSMRLHWVGIACFWPFGCGRGGLHPVVRVDGGGCGDSLGFWEDTKWRMDWMDGDM